jgi:hypothetical protein
VRGSDVHATPKAGRKREEGEKGGEGRGRKRKRGEPQARRALMSG